jgi:hypothetical protein
LRKAKEDLAPWAAAMKLLREKDQQSDRLIWPLAKYLWAVGPKMWQAVIWRSLSSRDVKHVLDSTFVTNLDWSLGRAYSLSGELDRALEHYDLALHGFAGVGGCEQRIAIQASKGLAYIETKKGDRTSNLCLALKCFGEALNECGQETEPLLFATVLLKDVRARLAPELVALVEPGGL